MDSTREYAGTAAIAIWAGRLVEAITNPATADGDMTRLVDQCAGELGDDGCSRATAGALGSIEAIRAAVA